MKTKLEKNRKEKKFPKYLMGCLAFTVPQIRLNALRMFVCIVSSVFFADELYLKTETSKCYFKCLEYKYQFSTDSIRFTEWYYIFEVKPTKIFPWLGAQLRYLFNDCQNNA